MYQKKRRLSVEEYTEGVLKGDRIILSKAITLVESTLEHDHLLAEKVIENILPKTGNSIRIGITGVPGVGKSTFIESFGKLVTSMNKKLAVLAIDPSSERSRGSLTIFVGRSDAAIDAVYLLAAKLPLLDPRRTFGVGSIDAQPDWTGYMTERPQH